MRSNKQSLANESTILGSSKLGFPFGPLSFFGRRIDRKGRRYGHLTIRFPQLYFLILQSNVGTRKLKSIQLTTYTSQSYGLPVVLLAISVIRYG